MVVEETVKKIKISSGGKMEGYVKEGLLQVSLSSNPVLFYASNTNALNKLVGVVEIIKREYTSGAKAEKPKVLAQQNCLSVESKTPAVSMSTSATDTTANAEEDEDYGPRNDDTFKAVIMSEAKRPKKQHRPHLSILLSSAEESLPLESNKLMSLLEYEPQWTNLQKSRQQDIINNRKRNRGKRKRKKREESKKDGDSAVNITTNNNKTGPVTIEKEVGNDSAMMVIDEKVEQVEDNEDDGTTK